MAQWCFSTRRFNDQSLASSDKADESCIIYLNELYLTISSELYEMLRIFLPVSVNNTKLEGAMV